ncbi:hypothetical protein FSP39_004790 [Pinctada imbricata]|uniref:Endonuclease n=2 Tax=Pinctada imbricata TaxID=66713 RepID=A0AA88Y1A9_PINIB|nr:hypothetical protein FSP39_004790 [Pinctada imbricata]
MAEKLTPPSELDLKGNLKENWRRFEQRFQIFLTASKINKESDEVKANTFLHIVGPDAVEIYNTFTWDAEGDEKKLDKIIQKFAGYCNPKKNITYERHIFNTRNQGTSENIDAYVTELRILAKSCEFGELQDSLIKDRIVCGVRNDSVKRRLLRESDLTLTKAIDICRASETSDNQMKSLSEAKPEMVDAVRKKGGLKNKDKKTPKFSQTPKPRYSTCSSCGRKHDQTLESNCPAHGQKCHKCGYHNHFAAMCKASSKNRRKKVYGVDPDYLPGSDSDEYAVGTINTLTVASIDTWTIEISLENKPVKLKLDTGAQCNIISYQLFNKMNWMSEIKRCKTKLVSYTGHKLPIKGKTLITAEYKGKIYPLEFYIVHGNAVPVLGLQACKELDLIKRVETVDGSCLSTEKIVDKYADVFEGIGRLKGKHHIHIDKSVKPVVHPPRRVPYKMQEKLKTELKHMESLDVIERVTEPSEWVNSMVIVEKPNRVRICLDPRDLNKAIMREHHPMKTVDDVAHQLSGAKVFSALDASSGFWGIVLDSESSKLTTFNTPFGRYRYKRMPFGVSSAPEVFQRKMSQIFEGIEGCAVIMDDILVWGKTIDEHNDRLHKVLEAVKRANIKLNRIKCKFQMPEVKYMGYIIGKDGLKTAEDRVKSIADFPKPKNVKELQRFFGMVNYVGRFVKNLTALTEPLRQLLEKNTAWHWEDRQQESFDKLKKALTEAPVLRYFNPKEEVTISVDASSEGLGACLLQKGQPVAYASRALNKSERNYAQIEKELLAIVFACKKFHQYLYGQRVDVETDHKPLESLFRKRIMTAPPRIQRMMLKVQNYELVVQYKPGKELYIADTLSRTKSGEVPDDYDRFAIHGISSSYLPITDEKLSEVAKQSRNDEEMSLLRNVIFNGWPKTSSECHYLIKDYWNFREELSVYNGIVTKGQRLVIPSSMREDILYYLHLGHAGIEKCRMRAREVVYWPGINADIEQKVMSCSTCNRYKNKQCKEPLIPHSVPLRPWQKVGIDLFELDKISYVVIVDYYSKFFEINELKSTTSKAIITKLRIQFARHGIPEELISDNAPNLTSAEFNTFCKDYGIKHTTSSPHYPQSNGMAERTVQTVKNILKKCKETKSDPNLAFLEYRNTPIEGIGSPSQLLFGRRTRSVIPTHGELLNPNNKSTRNVRRSLKSKQRRTKQQYDKNARPLTELKPGDVVNIQTQEEPWKKGVVLDKRSEPRSYTVESEGVKYRRNRRDLRQVPELCERDDNHVDDEIQHRNEPSSAPDNNSSDNAYRTRSGRAVHLPEKFKDFQMYK